MTGAGAGFGFMCPFCGFRVDILGTVGGDPQRCPQCGRGMVPNPNARISAKVTCNKCHSQFGLINSDNCPVCGEPFA
jgi:hypothetical protein